MTALPGLIACAVLVATLWFGSVATIIGTLALISLVCFIAREIGIRRHVRELTQDKEAMLARLGQITEGKR